MNAKVDGYIGRAKTWREVMETLRPVLLDSPLTEELKWGKPCYTLEGANVVLMVAFKDYCALLFAKGSLLKDPKGLLVAPTENTQATRQLRLTSVEQAAKLRATVKAYINDAIAVEKSGQEVVYKKVSEFPVPEELTAALAKSPTFKHAFESLTPGRQRGYLLHFSGAKQAQTRESRIEKCRPLIMSGKGLHD